MKTTTSTTIKVATSGKNEFESAIKKTKTIEILGYTKGRKYTSFVITVVDISELFLLGRIFSESFETM
jgi:hypothetical protein